MARVPPEPRSTAGRSAGRSVVPLTVIAGYVGAGKTTLLTHLLHNNEGERIAVLVNDFDRVGIDESLVSVRTVYSVRLTNGCVCCRCGGDVGDALAELDSHPVEHVLVEATASPTRRTSRSTATCRAIGSTASSS